MLPSVKAVPTWASLLVLCLQIVQVWFFLRDIVNNKLRFSSKSLPFKEFQAALRKPRCPPPYHCLRCPGVLSPHIILTAFLTCRIYLAHLFVNLLSAPLFPEHKFIGVKVWYCSQLFLACSRCSTKYLFGGWGGAQPKGQTPSKVFLVPGKERMSWEQLSCLTALQMRTFFPLGRTYVRFYGIVVCRGSSRAERLSPQQGFGRQLHLGLNPASVTV